MRIFICSILALGTLAMPMVSAAKPKKGAEAGRMCSKDDDCQSGTCKMENKTRGRCTK